MLVKLEIHTLANLSSNSLLTTSIGSLEDCNDKNIQCQSTFNLNLKFNTGYTKVFISITQTKS